MSESSFETILDQWKHMFTTVMKESFSTLPPLTAVPFETIGQTFQHFTISLHKNPSSLAEMMEELTANLWELGLGFYDHLLTGTPKPFIQEEKGDKRFRHPSWVADPYFSYIKHMPKVCIHIPLKNTT